MAHFPSVLVGLMLCLADVPGPAVLDRDFLPPYNPVIASSHTLAKLTPRQARLLHGRRALYRVVLDSPDDREGQYDVYQCQGDDAVEVTLWLPADEETEDEMTIEAVLLVIQHPEKVTQTGTRFEGFIEYRLTYARRR